MSKVDEIMELLEGLTLLDASDLVKKLKKSLVLTLLLVVVVWL